MRSRRVAAGGTILFVLIGIFRGAVQAGLRHAGAAESVRLLAATITVSCIWVPVVLLVDRSWRAGWRRGVFGAVHLAGAVAMSLIEPLWMVLVRSRPRQELGPWMLFRLDTNLLIYLSILAATWAVERQRIQTESELAASELERSLAGAQLHVLTLQLHPHFLFNTLNLISQLAYESVSEALRTLANLRALLVQSLEHASRREVSLGDELGFLRSYLDIQQRRFRERLTVTLTIDDDALSAAVPHLLLQPLVENAIVHGIAPRAARGRIDVTARRSGDRLRIEIADDGPGVVLPVRDGMGLGNTRLRLEQLYSADQSLLITRNVDAGSVVAVDVPFRPAVTTSSDIEADRDGHVDEQPESPGPRDTRLRRTLPAVQVIASWTAIAAAWTELESLERGVAESVFTWSGSALSNLANAALWIVLTPLVVLLARRVDLGRARSAGPFVAHLLLGAIVAFIHCAAWLALLDVALHSEFHRHLDESFDWLLWDFVAYAGIVAFATVTSLRAKQRDVRIAVAANRARLARATVAGLRLRLQPGILLGGLDAIATAIGRDAERAEVAIARMGDLLRGLLGTGEREDSTVADDLALARAYLDVIGAGEDRGAAIDAPAEGAFTGLRIPALSIVSLIAIVHGPITDVGVAREDGTLVIRVRSTQGRIDEARLSDLDHRLRARGDARHRLQAVSNDRNAGVELTLTMRGVGDAAGDEAMELVTA